VSTTNRRPGTPGGPGSDDAVAGGDPSRDVAGGAVPPAMVTDLYELTMAAAYRHAGITHEATFELSVRSLPAARRFLVAAGLDGALRGLESFRFGPGELAWLAGLGWATPDFLDHLAGLRFTGEVWAVPEGEVVFAGEPLLRVTAPLIEAQLVETFLLNQVASQTMVASKAARVALATGPDRSFVDFSARRDHGVDAAMTAARAAWIAGADGTSLVAASQRWGIPPSGTMAHSFVMAFDDERDAFRCYARAFHDRVVLLIDTYDTLQGARNAVEVARDLEDEGVRIAAVRLDSGDLLPLSLAVRRVLDGGGLHDTRILASGDLDEHRIADLVAAGAPIDAFGVGTQLGTSGDAPSLGAVYKLVEDAGGPRMKLAEGKVTLPGRKQVWRLEDRDVVGLHDEHPPPGGRPLLVRVMAAGRRLPAGREPLAAARERCAAALDRLPEPLRSLDPVGEREGRWPVDISAGLRTLTASVQAGHTAGVRRGAAGRTSPSSPSGAGQGGCAGAGDQTNEADEADEGDDW
jgi:nicotinate phosphoribosyltransferase